MPPFTLNKRITSSLSELSLSHERNFNPDFPYHPRHYQHHRTPRPPLQSPLTTCSDELVTYVSPISPLSPITLRKSLHLNAEMTPPLLLPPIQPFYSFTWFISLEFSDFRWTLRSWCLSLLPVRRSFMDPKRQFLLSLSNQVRIYIYILRGVS